MSVNNGTMADAVFVAEQGKRVLLVAELLSDWPELIQATVNHRTYYRREEYLVGFRAGGLIQLTSLRSIRNGGIRGKRFDEVVTMVHMDAETLGELKPSLM